MDISKYLRVRDTNDYTMDIEEFIKSIETNFKIDFTSLPQWRQLIEIMNIVQLDYKMKVRSAAHRKHEIIQKIYTQNSRLTPFELTDKLIRTSKLWRDMKHQYKNMKPTNSNITDELLIISCDLFNSTSVSAEQIALEETPIHPNTEEVLVEERQGTELELKSPNSSCLPIYICTNNHKTVSPLSSIYSLLPNTEIKLSDVKLTNTINKNILSPTRKCLVKFYPAEINITNDTLKKQIMKLFITNCCTCFLNLRFKKISDCSFFRNVKVLPCTTIKLYPGLTATFKFSYTLKNKSINNIASSLQFRFACSELSESAEEVTIPIKSSFMKARTVTITDPVTIPPNYSWQISPKSGYPKAVVHIKNTDDACYCLHIRKRNVNFAIESSDSIKSDEVISLDSHSLFEREEDKELELQSTILSTPNTKKSSAHFDKLSDDLNIINTIDIVELIVKDLIDLALEPFIFKHTHLCIEPRSRKFVIVYFTKVHHIGYHQSYYDFIFTDSKDNDITLTKTTKVFAEVLPHPITIDPKILDMSKSPVTFGYLKDSITIINSHKVFPVTINIMLTSKMQRIFKIIPMERVVPAQSSSIFYVMVCTKETEELIPDDLAYFTIKILIKGHESIYKNVPPFFYEIIAPCGTQFKRVYGTKYYSDLSELNISTSCKNLEDTRNSNVL